MKKYFGLLLIFSFFAKIVIGQVSINIDNSQPDSSAMLDIKAVNKGLLPPRIELTGINIAAPVVSPAIGLLVYNTATSGEPPYKVTPGYYYWDGSNWVTFIKSTEQKIDTALLLYKGDSIAPKLYTTPHDLVVLKDSITWNYQQGVVALKNLTCDVHIGKKLIADDIQTIYIPDREVFNQSLIIGNGGENLTTSAPNPLSYPGNSGEFNGQYNTFVGFGSGVSNTSGNMNTFVGTSAGNVNTIGDQNLFVGTFAGEKNTTGFHSAFVGAFAGYANTSGNSNVFVGTDCGLYNTTGSENVFLGTDCGTLNTTGICNTFTGISAGWNNNANYNCFYGKSTGHDNTTGTLNSFFGFGSGLYNTTGSLNCFFGSWSGSSNRVGSSNTFLGHGSGFNSFGNENVAIGTSALFSSTDGSSNTAIGTYSGNSITIGNNNTFLGSSAGSHNLQKTDAVNSMALGSGTYTTADNQVVIGNDAVTQTLLHGSVGIGTTAPSSSLDVNGLITASGGNSGNWNSAFAWGNHADAGYVHSASPVFTGTSTFENTAINANPTATASSGELVTLPVGMSVDRGDVVYISSAGTTFLCKADTISNCPYAFAIATLPASQDSLGTFMTKGVLRNDAWPGWTVGGLVYVSTAGTTSNTLTQTAPSAPSNVIAPVGVALGVKTIYFFGNLKPSILYE